MIISSLIEFFFVISVIKKKTIENNVEDSTYLLANKKYVRSAIAAITIAMSAQIKIKCAFLI